MGSEVEAQRPTGAPASSRLDGALPVSWWCRQAKEIQVAIITALVSLASTIGGLAGAVIADTPADAPEPRYCIQVLDDIDNFLDKDPRNIDLLLAKGPNGEPVIKFDAAARQCGVYNEAVLKGLAGDEHQPSRRRPQCYFVDRPPNQ
jgi:hypothetical protein